ncbi:hypothetical protein, partial [Streptomyces sp. NRRL WC-3742]|uniref:hypothetical protein n=1 Tax=Streptomyces sp. NRRL WC-3742 TaxID=1463934 RepID=UPI0004C7CBBE
AHTAALLLAAADTARRTVDAPLPPAERTDVNRITDAARTTLGPTAFTHTFTRGTHLTPAQALREAAPVLAELTANPAPAGITPPHAPTLSATPPQPRPRGDYPGHIG